MPPQDKVLDRVRKLLRLATSDNLHEAANAAARAQELLDRHRIDEQLRSRLLDPDRQDQPLPSEIVDGRDEPLDSSKRLRKWKIFLGAQLAPLNECRVYTFDERPRKKMIHLVAVGRLDDIDALRTLYQYCVTAIECLTRSHGTDQDRQWRDGFRMGAAQTLAKRMADRRSDLLTSLDPPLTQALAQSNDLVPIGHTSLFEERLARVDDWMQSTFSSQTTKSRGIRYLVDAFEAGGEAAKSLPLAPK